MTQTSQITQSIYQQVLKVSKSLDSMRWEGLSQPETAIPALERLHAQEMALKRMVGLV